MNDVTERIADPGTGDHDPRTRSRRIVVIGSVAAGTSVAAKARRGSEADEIVVYERDRDISYSGCGIPYFVGAEVDEIDALRPRDPAWFAKRYAVDVRTGHEVVDVDPAARTVTVRDLAGGTTAVDRWDVLVLATGARSVVPDIPGVDRAGVFTVRNLRDAEAVRGWVDDRSPTNAVVLGSGFIGLEMTEQLAGRGIAVTLVEAADQVMPALDADMSALVEGELRRHDVSVLTGRTATALTGEAEGAAVTAVSLDDGTVVAADLVVLAVGVRPDTTLARRIGARIGVTGAVAVDRRMRTDVPDVYAVGDVAESFSVITGAPIWRPLGSTANKMGRIAGDAISGGTLEHRGILGTGILRVFGVTVAHTGLTQAQASAAGLDVEVLHNLKPDRPEYLGGKQMTIKALADRATGRLVGAQIVGPQGVDKRIDVLATAMSFGAVAADLFHLDLAYAPPFATTKDPVLYTGMALDNAITGAAPLITARELDARRAAGERLQVVDVRSARDFERGHVPGAVNIPLGQLRARAGELDPTVPTVAYCNKGVSGNAGQNVLRNLGFRQVWNLSGGNSTYQAHLRRITAESR